MGVNATSPSAVDTGSDPDVERAGAEPISRKSNASLLLFSFPDIISQVKAFEIWATYT